MVSTDATFLPYLLGHASIPPINPSTNLAVDGLQARIDLLVETLDSDNETILIPQPAFSEFLVLADKDGQKYITRIEKSPLYRWGDFDLRAAVELAALRRTSLKSMSNRELKRQTPAETKAKVSFDRQIVAISKANGAHTIYSDDDGVRRFAERHGLRVVGTWQLPYPKIEAQRNFEELLVDTTKDATKDEKETE